MNQPSSPLFERAYKQMQESGHSWAHPLKTVAEIIIGIHEYPCEQSAKEYARDLELCEKELANVRAHILENGLG